MAFTTTVKRLVNARLRHLNLRLDTLTAERTEDRRLATLERSGHFTRPVFPLPEAFRTMNDAPVFRSVAVHASRFAAFEAPDDNDVGYSFDNIYFTSPDAEVLYAIIRTVQPRTVIEIGCGNSTKIAHQAILDGRTSTRLVCIDPRPRIDIRTLADHCFTEPVEALADQGLLQSLQAGDLLFIDSSHAIRTGNDVVTLYSTIVPRLPPGVLIHIHDIFLPYDYPKEWVLEARWGFAEQYLVHALLMFSNAFDVLWAGHYLQRTRADFAEHFPHMKEAAATSLWLRTRA